MASDILAPLLVVGIVLFTIASMWKAFEKAGLYGWKVLIPILNVYFVLKVADVTPWILIGFFIPFIAPIFAFYAYYKFAENFGMSLPLCVLTGIFPFVGVPIIAFGDATYEGEYLPPESS